MIYTHRIHARKIVIGCLAAGAFILITQYSAGNKGTKNLKSIFKK